MRRDDKTLREAEAQPLPPMAPGPGTRRAAQLLRQGNARLARGQVERARALYARAVETAPSAAAHNNLAVALYKAGRFDEAEAAYQQALRLDPRAFEPHYGLGVLYKDRRDYARAAEQFSRALRRSRRFGPAFHSRGIAYFHLGRLEEAARDFARAGALAPRSAEAFHNLATCQFRLGRYADAERSLERCLELEPRNADVYYHFGVVHAADPATPPERAIEALRTALRLDAEHSDARFKLAMVYARHRHVIPDGRRLAIAQLRRLLRVPQPRGRTFAAHEAWLALGSLYDDEPADARRAMRAYRRAIAGKSDFAPAHNNLGVVYRARGDTRRALECFGRAIFADPDYHIAYHNVASIYLGENEELVRCDLPRYLQAPEALQGRREGAPSGSPQGAAPAEMICRLLLAMVDAARADAYQRTWQEMHRVKNLLGLLGSRARSAAERTGDPAARKVVDLTQRTYDEIAHRLRALRRDEPSLRPTDLAEVVRRAVTAVRAAAPANIEFAVRAGAHPHVRADADQLGEALRNVLTNALEAMPNGGKVSVAVRQEKSHLEIRVSDTGAGIAPEHRSSVLVPGFSTKPGGSGLGLTLARGILFDHGGDLTIESAPEKGTAVTLRLPLGEPFVPAATQLHLRPVLLEDARQMITQEFTETE